VAHAVTRGLNPEAEVKDSGVEWLGSVPVHWSLKRLKDLLRTGGIVRGPFGGDLKTDGFVEKGFKVYEQKNAIYRSATLGASFIPDEKYAAMRRFRVKPGDVIMSCSGTVGRSFRVPSEAPEGIINQALLIMRFGGELDPSFTDQILLSDFFEKQILDNSQGGAMKNLVGMSVFKQIRLPVPPLDEQRLIAIHIQARCADIDKIISKSEQTVSTLREYRSALITEAVTGKIDVRGAA
jgi:type I restriction enzyme S subunit